jgi:hypothetical protein
MNYEIQQPNWLFCLSNELHDAKAATMLMKTQRLRCVFDASATKTLMKLNGWLRYINNIEGSEVLYETVIEAESINIDGDGKLIFRK